MSKEFFSYLILFLAFFLFFKTKSSYNFARCRILTRDGDSGRYMVVGRHDFDDYLYCSVARVINYPGSRFCGEEAKHFEGKK